MRAHQCPTPESESTSVTAGPAPDEVPASNAFAVEGMSGEGEATAQFDTPNHIGIGDSVGGEAIVVKDVSFTPGEAAALVDFVGPLENLEEFSYAELVMIKALVSKGIEDSGAWDQATGGKYTVLAQDNEDHFGAQIGTTFVAAYAKALGRAQEAQAYEEGSPEFEAAMNEARLAGYTAEHYLEDAFSAGHQVEPDAIAEAVSKAYTSADEAWMYPLIAHEIFVRAAETIACYGYVKNVDENGLVYEPIDSEAEFFAIAIPGALVKGQGGIEDGVRKWVHEELARIGVEVCSEAAGTWVLQGDHGLPQDEVGAQALQAALSDARTRLELAVPGTDPEAEAQALFDHHAPKPTEEVGQKTVDAALERATAGPLALASAVAEATVGTIVDVMNGVVSMTNGAVTRIADPAPDARAPEIPEFTPYPGGPAEDPIEQPGQAPGGPSVDPIEQPGPGSSLPPTGGDVHLDPVEQVPSASPDGPSRRHHRRDRGGDGGHEPRGHRRDGERPHRPHRPRR